ncbi:MAG: endospore germination permease [Clostridia bacterium]|nr:endospore germination permease [Clostridia bacterium]
MIRSNDRITTWQMFILLISAINAIEVLIFPRQLATEVGPDGWISLIGGHLLAAISLFFIIKLGLLFPNETFAEYTPRIAGNIFGTFFVLLAASYWILITARILRQFGDFIILILDRTPIEILILSKLVLAAFIVRYGVEVIARICEILFPLFICLIFVLTMVAVPEMDFSNFQPVLSSDFKSLSYSIINTALGLEGKEIFSMLIPFMIVQVNAFKVGYAAIGLNLVLRLMIFIATIAVFGVDITKIFIWPAEELGRIVAAPGQFFGRLDALLIGLWVTVTFSSVIIYYYLASLTLSHLLKFREHSIMVFPLFPVIFLLSLVPKNILETDQFSYYTSFIFGALVYVIPPLLILISYIRGTHKKRPKGGG